MVVLEGAALSCERGTPVRRVPLHTPHCGRHGRRLSRFTKATLLLAESRYTNQEEG